MLKFTIVITAMVLFSASVLYGQTSDLFLQDIPVFKGIEKTQERLDTVSKDHPIWALNLSGGSARAFAHIGVLKRLEEDGLRPDVIITNSMGSIVGMAYAAGMKVADIEDIIKSVTLSHYFDLEFPSRGGIISVRRFRALMNAIIGDIDISESPIPIFVVTEDLKTKRQVIISEGNFNDVLSASFALPVYFNPVNIDGYRLIDGGVSNLVPIKHFHSLLPNMVVSSTFYNADINLNNPVTILNVTMDISKARRAVNQIKEYSPFLIRCDVEKISYMDFGNSEFIIDKGYESCSRSINGLKSYLESRGIYPSKDNIRPFKVSGAYTERWNSLKKKINYIDLPLTGTGHSSSMGLLNWKTYGGKHYLKQDIFLEESNIFWNRNFVLGGGIFSDMGNPPSPGVKFQIDSVFGSFLSVESDAAASFDLSAFPSLNYDELYFSGYIKAVVPVSGVVLVPLLNIEDSYLFDSGINRTLIRPEAVFNYSLPAIVPLHQTEVIQSLGSYHSFTDNELSGTGLTAEQTILFPLTRLTDFHNREFLKIPLGENTKSARLSYPDFYRSSDTTIFSGTDEYFSSYIISNNSINFKLGEFLPTFGEMFILDKTELFVFTDLFVSSFLPDQSGGSVRTSTGGGINLSASLIGLQPWSVSLMGGFDFYRSRFFFTLNIN